MAATFALLRRHGGVDGLRQAVQGDSELRAQVQAELDSLTTAPPGQTPPTDRCVATKEYVAGLREALE